MARSLQDEVAHYAGRGFTVVSQTDTTAQLVKPKKFSLLLFFLLLGVFYIPFYVAKKDETIYLYVDDDGTVHRRGGKWTLGSWLFRRISGRA